MHPLRHRLVHVCLSLSLLVLLAAQKPQRVSVSIRDMAYSPASVTVKVGDTVVWTNRDDQDHTVNARDGSFSSGNLKPGDTFTHRFAKAGKYAYSCSLHPRMKGTVVVE